MEKDKKNKVALMGTCNNSTWRDKLIEMLTIDYFNPVVDDWTEDCMAEEIKQRETCDFCLYVITPLIMGVYSIAEVVDDSNKRPEKVIFCILDIVIDKRGQKRWFVSDIKKSLGQVKKMVKENGAKVFDTLEEIAEFLNGEK